MDSYIKQLTAKNIHLDTATEAARILTKKGKRTQQEQQFISEVWSLLPLKTE